MVREIQRLQRRNDDLEDTLGERNNRIIQIMHSLKTEGQGTEIINRLKRGESHQNIAESLGRPMVGNQGDPDSSPTTPRSFSQAIQDYYGGLLENHDPRYWTNVTTDANLIEHLITLYFTWIHPVHLLLDEQHFMASFRDCKDTYCSSALVNIICAMSCHLLHDTQDGDERTKSAIISLRSRFIDETQLLMRNIDFGKWTNIQTYAIMFLVEVSSGHGLIASSHLRLAVENLIAKQTSEQSSEAEELAAWGILTLHTCVPTPAGKGVDFNAD